MDRCPLSPLPLSLSPSIVSAFNDTQPVLRLTPLSVLKLLDYIPS